MIPGNVRRDAATDGPLIGGTRRTWVALGVGVAVAAPVWAASYVAASCGTALFGRVGTDTTAWLLVCLVYPVLEELVFRGWLQGELQRVPRLQSALAGISLANVVTTAAFCAAHLLRGPAAAAAVLLPSLMLGWARDYSGRLLPGITLHIIYNTGYLTTLALATR